MLSFGELYGPERFHACAIGVQWPVQPVQYTYTQVRRHWTVERTLYTLPGIAVFHSHAPVELVHEAYQGLY